MNWLRDIFAKLFGGKKKTDWDKMAYDNGKPSKAGDDFRDINQV